MTATRWSRGAARSEPDGLRRRRSRCRWLPNDGSLLG
jgi:hypothetical protein